MSSRHYTLEELRRKQLKIEQRQAELAEKARRTAARHRALDRKVSLQEAQERDEYLRSLGLILEGFLPKEQAFTPEQAEELLRSVFTSEKKEDDTNE